VFLVSLAFPTGNGKGALPRPPLRKPQAAAQRWRSHRWLAAQQLTSGGCVSKKNSTSAKKKKKLFFALKLA